MKVETAIPIYGTGFPELEGGMIYISYCFSYVLIGIAILQLIPLTSVK